MENKYNCLVCGEEIVYSEQSEKLKCFYCKKEFSSNAKCKNGHFVCDSCHSLGAYEIIKKYCNETVSKNPLKIAIDLMKHPSIKMHGPEHHFLVPAVLTAAYYNTINKRENIKDKLEEVEKRAKNILGGFCGFYGNCGAAVGTGIFMSVITGATPLSKKEWKMANLMTSKSLLSISEFGGPRCCKRDTFLSIEEAVDFIEENLNVTLEKQEVKCNFSNINKQCLKEECKFH